MAVVQMSCGFALAVSQNLHNMSAQCTVIHATSVQVLFLAQTTLNNGNEAMQRWTKSRPRSAPRKLLVCRSICHPTQCWQSGNHCTPQITRGHNLSFSSRHADETNLPMHIQHTELLKVIHYTRNISLYI